MHGLKLSQPVKNVSNEQTLNLADSPTTTTKSNTLLGACDISVETQPVSVEVQ